MPAVTVYPNGGYAGVAPSVNTHKRAKRDVVGGWSQSSTRGNVRFLQSVRSDRLTGDGYTFTLTLRECPSSSDEWQKMRRAWVKRCEYQGMIRMHWVVEWQSRGVPHLHGALWLPESDQSDIIMARLVFNGWAQGVAAKYGSGLQGQHFARITETVGWFKYLSKHAARGVSHYQRNPENIPEGWTKTGRMWGHVGNWPTDDGTVLRMDSPGFAAYRRLVRRWRIADARRELQRSPESRQSLRRLKLARSMLKDPVRGRSAVRGVSEWIPQRDNLALVAAVAAQGHPIDHA